MLDIKTTHWQVKIDGILYPQEPTRKTLPIYIPGQVLIFRAIDTLEFYCKEGKEKLTGDYVVMSVDQTARATSERYCLNHLPDGVEVIQS